MCYIPDLGKVKNLHPDWDITTPRERTFEGTVQGWRAVRE